MSEILCNNRSAPLNAVALESWYSGRIHVPLDRSGNLQKIQPLIKDSCDHYCLDQSKVIRGGTLTSCNDSSGTVVERRSGVVDSLQWCKTWLSHY